jgi:hypothetical protein
MSDLKSILKENIEDVSIDEIRRALEDMIEDQRKKAAKKEAAALVDNFLDEIEFNRKLLSHPILMKVINRANLSNHIKRTECYARLDDKLKDVLSQGTKIEDIKEIKYLLDCLKGKAIEYIVEVEASKAEQGMRHIHAPGSVARSEGRNLYFPGEEYTREGLNWLASKLCGSIAIGDNLGVFSENNELMLKLKQLVSYKELGTKLTIDPRKLEIKRDEMNYPYATLLAFILWLRKQLSIEENVEIKALIQSILDDLRVSTLNLFFVPPPEKYKHKWSTISLPRLDIFIVKWILDEKSRNIIENFREALADFITEARNASKRKKKGRELENVIDLLMNNYDFICKSLIEHGILDTYAARKIIDIVIDIATKYDIRRTYLPLGMLVSL